MKLLLLVPGLLLGSLVLSTVQAAPPPWGEAPGMGAPAVDPGARISAQEAARRAQARHGGKVLDVKAEGAGFRVKLIKGGEVRTVYVGP